MAKTKVVSYSELDALRQCRLKHQLAYKERWVGPTTSAALERGSLFHEVMELHYRRLKEGIKPAGIVQEVQTSGLLSDPHTGGSSEMQDLVAWMYTGYVEHYGGDEDWEIIDVEFKVEEWLPTPWGTRSSFRLKGRIDVLVRDNSAGGGLWVVDHKTCKRLPRGKDLDLDDQMGIYTYLLRRGGLDIRGTIYNSVRTEKLVRPMSAGERFQRALTVRGDRELETMATEAYETFLDAYRPRVHGGSTGTVHDAPRSPDPDRCGWRCSYTEACLLGRKGADLRDLLAETGYEIDLERH